MIAAKEEVREILERVRRLPPEDRLQLAEEILHSLRATPVHPGKTKTLEDLWGLLRTAGPPPDDAECERILEEELLKKHLW